MVKKLFNVMIFILLAQVSIFAQFGKNKVQYKSFDWYYIQTKHFDIYFNKGGDMLAEFTAQAAEDALSKLQESFKYDINNRITIITYNSQNDFQESNVTDSYLSEGIEGFTELFKNRVVIQFTGSYKEFRHLIHHELTHAVMNDMFYGGSLQNIISNNISLDIPTWFSEGMAEYQSVGWDIDEDMFIRDAAINESLPDVNRLSGYLAYRGGQAVFYYIEKKYGKGKISELIHNLKGAGNVDGAFKQTLGLDIKEFNERWDKDIKRTFWPDIDLTLDPDEYAKRLTNPEDNDGSYNTSPAISPKGDKIAFITNRDFFFNLYIMDANTGKIIKELASGNIAPDFEELNIVSPGLTWSPDGNSIAISALHHGYDEIYLIDVESGDYKTVHLKLDAINGLSWSWDKKYIAFVGQTARQSDIYIYDIETGSLTNLTNDIFSDSDPVWLHNGEKIYFVSDRGDYLDKNSIPDNFKIYDYNYNQSDIYSIDVTTKNIKRITDYPESRQLNPLVNEDDTEILFISDMTGIKNIYKKRIVFNADDKNISNIKDIEVVPITNSQSGVYQMSVTKDGKKLAFSTLYKSSFNIFLLNNPFESMLENKTLPMTKYKKRLLKLSNEDEILSDNDNTGNQDSDSLRINTSPFFTGNIIDTTSTYGDSIEVSYGNYIFGADQQVKKTEVKDSTDLVFDLKDNLDKEGKYIVNRYKVNFGSDLVYANAGYSTLYGFVGTTVISYSDVLGNHRLVGLLGLQIDLKNSDYGLAYYYLAKRINWGIQAFHTARFIRLLNGGYANLYRFRNFGLIGSASYPLDKFYRIDTGLSWLYVKNENLDDITEPSENVGFVVPSVSFVHDNVLWGYTAPIEGTRYRFDLLGDLGIDDPGGRFISFLADYRTYLRFFYDHSFAVRFSGGVSYGGRPQRFFIGGVDNWINRSYSTTEVPIQSAADFVFLTAALPLRGYDYAEQVGTKYALMNMELRFPLIRYLVTGGIPLLFSNIQGALFLDAGTAWNKNAELRFFKKNEANHLVTDDLLVGTGVGARVFFLYFLLKFDVAWAYDIEGFTKPKFYFSLGADF